MKYNKQFAILFSILLFSGTYKLKAQDCDELIHYRDVELIKQYDQIIDNFTKKYKINQEAINDIKRIKRETLDEKGWDELMSTGTAISDRGVTIAQIAAVIKTYCDLIKGVAEMLPVEGEAIGAAKSVKFSAEQIYHFIEKGNTLKEISERNETKLMEVEVKYILSELDIAGKAMKVALEFNKNMTELIKIPEEREKLKNEVERILDMMDNAIARYQENLKDSKEALDQTIQIVNGITQYLSKNCKNFSPPKKQQIPLKEKISATEQKTVVINKNTPGNSFYIFLTTTLQSSKTLYAISKPVLHEGSLKDDMQNEKQQFIADMQKQFANEPKLLTEIYNTQIEVHYGKPYSTTLLKTEEDGFDAIEAYKKSEKELVEGLAEVDFLILK